MGNTAQHLLVWFFAALFITVPVFLYYWHDRTRRRTLRKRDDGMYVWNSWPMGERCSPDDPSEPGGKWDIGRGFGIGPGDGGV